MARWLLRAARLSSKPQILLCFVISLIRSVGLQKFICQKLAWRERFPVIFCYVSLKFLWAVGKCLLSFVSLLLSSVIRPLSFYLLSVCVCYLLCRFCYHPLCGPYASSFCRYVSVISCSVSVTFLSSFGKTRPGEISGLPT